MADYAAPWIAGQARNHNCFAVMPDLIGIHGDRIRRLYLTVIFFADSVVFLGSSIVRTPSA
jgi:hypothetical protein